MAIDADMNAGLIDEHRSPPAAERRSRARRSSTAPWMRSQVQPRRLAATILLRDQYVRACNRRAAGTDLMTAVKTYTILTVGDGLVTMIPSLLVTVAVEWVLTRASRPASWTMNSGSALARRKTLWIACGVLAIMALVPGMPLAGVSPDGSRRGNDCATLARGRCARRCSGAASAARRAPLWRRPRATIWPVLLKVGGADAADWFPTDHRWSTRSRAARC